MSWSVHFIVPIITAPIDDFLGEKEAKHLHVATGYKGLCENAIVVIDWTRQAVSIMCGESSDTVAGPPLGTKHNVVPALVKVIASVIVCVSKQYIPHGRHMSLAHILHFDELKPKVLEYNGKL